MLRGLYTAYTGMRGQQDKMDSVANNLANANTIGYKKDQVVLKSFDEIWMTRIKDSESGMDQRIGKMSFGVAVDEVYTSHRQGSLKQTNERLNIALQGQGMIKIGELQKDGTMTEKYTRDGSFKLDQQGRLVTDNGLFVLNEEGGMITLPHNQVRISQEGSIYANTEKVGQLNIVGFEDMRTLRKEGSSQYIGTKDMVEKIFEGTVEQGFLESSNTNSVEEMINMMAVMRSYEANQKILQTYDGTLDKTINSVGVVR